MANEIEKQDKGIMAQAEDLLQEVRSDLPAERVTAVPIAELTALGSGVSSLIPAFRTVTQTVSVNAGGLYKLANASVGDVLKAAKNGNFWGALETLDGKSKFAQWAPADPLTVKSSMVMPINPATIMMAAALLSIEKKLDTIAEIEKQILSFLETEKQSEIEADVETLVSIITKYKHNWDNDTFIKSNHKLVLDIQRTARKNMLSYQKRIAEMLQSKGLLTVHTQVESILKDLTKNFKYYRLSLYNYGLASFLEIMLSGNFSEDNISNIRNGLEEHSMEYRNLFNSGSVYLEKRSADSIETTVLKGFGNATKTMGKIIGSIPLVKEGPVDEFLVDSGEGIGNNGRRIENNVLMSFSPLSNPETGVLIDKMDDMIQIYNHTNQICFDSEKIYLIG